jgi:ABC-type uncharacterized transport system involved in gliding motility auxiliary subunit
MSKLGKISFAFSIIALLGFAIVRLLFGGWMPFYTVLLAFFVFFAGCGFFLDRKFFAEFFTMKTTKHGMNMGVMIILVVVGLIVVNYIAVKRNKTWDFSQAQSNTLSDQSIKVVQGLKSELKVLFFYKEGSQGLDENRKAFRELLKKYQDKSNLVHLEFYELNEHPKLAEDYGVTKGGGLAFVEYEGHKNRLERIDEQEVTQAIIKVTRPNSKTAYYLTGHGEANFDDSQEATGVNALKLLIENNSFNVKPWNLPSAPQAPSDADAVLIVGPTQKFADYELKALEDYLKKGGNILMALEPGKTEGLETLLQKVGVKPGNNYIRSSFMGMGFIDGLTLGNVFSLNSAITKVFSNQRDVVRMSWPMDLKTEKAPEGIKVEAIVKTDQNATAFPTPKIEVGKYPQGPFQLGLEVNGQWPGGGEKPFQLIVFGDSEFMMNQYLYQSLNRDLVLNSVSQLSKEENLISISPREVQRTDLQVTTAKVGAFYIFMAVIPLCLFVSAIVFFLRRRRA